MTGARARRILMQWERKHTRERHLTTRRTKMTDGHRKAYRRASFINRQRPRQNVWLPGVYGGA